MNPVKTLASFVTTVRVAPLRCSLFLLHSKYTTQILFLSRDNMTHFMTIRHIQQSKLQHKKSS